MNERILASKNDYLSDNVAPTSGEQAPAMVHDNPWPQDVKTEILAFQTLYIIELLCMHDLQCMTVYVRICTCSPCSPCYRTTTTTNCMSGEYLYQQQ